MFNLRNTLSFSGIWAWLVLASALMATAETLDLGSRLELFVDDYLIEQRSGTTFRLHEPQPAGVVLKFDRPWEGAFVGYATVIKDGDTCRLYYRGLPKAGQDGSENEVTCYAESRDGIHWQKPDLGLFAIQGSRQNNVVLHGYTPASHNFSPFLDLRPGVPATERFKAVGGTQGSGLLGFVSPDGIHWRKIRDQPVFTKGIFDSQNVVFWSETERCYVCYFRTWTGQGYRGFRTISRATSPDFLAWSAPEPMSFGDTPTEHLYTSQTHPYFRAPHIYIATPMRLLPGRKVLTDAQAKALGLHANYQSDCADAVFMTSRGGTRYHRTFMEAWIRPGTDLGNWASRAGLTALGVVPTGLAEMSVYKQANYAQPSACLVRYTLRTDGFVSVNAPYRGGELLTKPLRFTGTTLTVNMATSAAGSVRVELQDEGGKPIPAYSLSDAIEIIGDEMERIVQWKSGSDLSSLRNRAVRLRFVMKDADLYSIHFR